MARKKTGTNISHTDSKVVKHAKKRKVIKRNDIQCQGYKARSRTFFPKGRHSLFFGPSRKPAENESNIHDRTIKRYGKSFLKDVAYKTHAHDLSIPSASGEEGGAMILRPIPEEEEEDCTLPRNNRRSGNGEYSMESGTMLVEKSNMMKALNSFINDHSLTGKCTNLEVDMVELQPWGLFISVRFTCKSCKYTSPHRYKLYEEVETNKAGRKAAAGNLRLALLNQDMAIGPTEVQLLFAAVGLHVNVKNLQKTAVKVSEITESLAREDMKKWLEYAHAIYKARGVEHPEHFSAEFDVLYHQMNRSNSHCPGQAASAATALCVETATPAKKIIEFEHSTRVCIKGQHLRAKNKPAVCGHATSKAHHKCTATIPPGQIIREYDMALCLAKRLKSAGKSVTHLVTDSDAKGRDAFVDVNKEESQLPELIWYKDPSHVSRNMRQKISNGSIAGKLFGKRKDGIDWNYDEKLECRKALALDVPKRVSLTLSNMRMYYKGNTKKMAENVGTVADYMVKCYGGDHTSCSSSRLAKLTGCSGPEDGKSWFSRSHVLKAQGVCSLDLKNTKYKPFLQSVINMKLSQENLGYFARGETSSKCEAANRGLNKSYAKNRKFWRAGPGRISSAILRINNGFLESTSMKFRHMKVASPAYSQGAIVIRKYQRKQMLTRKSQMSHASVERRHKLIAERAARYFRERTKDTNESDYMKHQLDEAREASSQAVRNISTANTQTLEEDVKSAQCMASHLKETLEHNYSRTLAVIAKKRNQKVGRKKKVKEAQELRQTELRVTRNRAARDPSFHYYPHRK